MKTHLFIHPFDKHLLRIYWRLGPVLGAETWERGVHGAERVTPVNLRRQKEPTTHVSGPASPQVLDVGRQFSIRLLSFYKSREQTYRRPFVLD